MFLFSHLTYLVQFNYGLLSKINMDGWMDGLSAALNGWNDKRPSIYPLQWLWPLIFWPHIALPVIPDVAFSRMWARGARALTAVRLYVVRFLSRVSILTRDIGIANLSVCPSIRPSVRNVLVSDENGLTYRHSFFHRTVAQSLCFYQHQTSSRNSDGVTPAGALNIGGV